MDSVSEALLAPFPKEVEKQLDKGGTLLTYIPVSEVIARLNDVVGTFEWSYTIIKCERDALDPDFLVAHVRLTVDSVTRDGVGGQKIKRTRNGDILDLGDEYKGAVSDALKKAAQSLGVGLYLARPNHLSTATTSSQQVRQQGDVTITEPAGKASDKQLNYIRSLLTGKGMTVPSGLQGFTSSEASRYIKQLLNPQPDDQALAVDDEPF